MIGKVFLSRTDKINTLDWQFGSINIYSNSIRKVVTRIEATWRRLSFPLHKESPNVYLLPVHLEGCQEVSYEENEPAEEVIKGKETHLTAWFESKKHPEGRHLLYKDYPKEFAFRKTTKEWAKRSHKTDTVSRMQNFSFKEVERYYLKVLLNHLLGATSFESLREVDGIKFNSYLETAKQLPEPFQCDHNDLLSYPN